MNDKRMQWIKSEGEYDYYLFTPTLFRQYYNKEEAWTEHRKSFSHKLHMLLYYVRGGYRILYMMEGDNIVAYLSFARCGRTVIRGTTREDIFTVFITTHPSYRKKGFAKKLVHEMLHGIGLSYRNAYKTIVDSNIGSVKAAADNGYQEVYQAKRSKFFKTISESGKGDWRLYLLKK